MRIHLTLKSINLFYRHVFHQLVLNIPQFFRFPIFLLLFISPTIQYDSFSRSRSYFFCFLFSFFSFHHPSLINLGFAKTSLIVFVFFLSCQLQMFLPIAGYETSWLMQWDIGNSKELFPVVSLLKDAFRSRMQCISRAVIVMWKLHLVQEFYFFFVG